MSAPADEDQRPTWYVAMPGHPEVFVTYLGLYYGEHQVEYSGWAENLCAAGVTLPAWAEPSGKHLRDAEGDRITVVRSWREDDGKPRRWFRVLRVKPSIDRLPGSENARAAMQRYEAWRERPRQETIRPQQGRPTLHLVIDNTRVRP